MKKFFIILISINFLLTMGLRAEASDPLILEDVRNVIPTALFSEEQFTNKDSLENLAKMILRMFPLSKLPENLKPETWNLEKGAVVILMHQINDVETFSEDTQQIHTIILHKENGKWSDYLLETKNLTIITLGGEEILQKANFDIKYEQSYFKETLKGIGILFKKLLNLSGNTIPVRLTVLNPNSIKAPCNLLINFSQASKNLKIKIHERSNFSFQAGIAAKSLTRQNFKIENQQLIVNIDSNNVKDWKGNFIAMFVFNPVGVDIDRFAPIWKKPKEHTFIYHIVSRTGIFGGVSISKDPIQNLFAGINFALSKDIYFNIGWNWSSQIANTTNNIDNITTIDEAKQYAKREYIKNNFIGISFSPSQIINNLGEQ